MKTQADVLRAHLARNAMILFRPRKCSHSLPNLHSIAKTLEWLDTVPSHAMRRRIPHQILGAIVAFIVCNGQTHVRAQSEEEHAKQLQNPVASLISVPFQNNFDFGGGYNDQAFRYQLNFQPVIPISIGKDWNIISRTILPFIHQDEYIQAVQKDGSLRSTSQTGLGDLLETFFISPKNPLPGGIIVGAGPAFAFPTKSDTIHPPELIEGCIRPISP